MIILNKLLNKILGKRSRKAEIAGQIFVYITSVVIIGLLIMFAVIALKKIGGDANKIDLIKFKSDIKSEVKQLRVDYGSSKSMQFVVPKPYTEVCFVNTADPASGVNLQRDSVFMAKYPIIYNSVKDGVTSNMFLFPKGQENDYIGPISLNANTPYLCKNVSSGAGTITLSMSGAGKTVKIE